jgi:cbb3-type cytochrome oxidase subunit 3
MNSGATVFLIIFFGISIVVALAIPKKYLPTTEEIYKKNYRSFYSLASIAVIFVFIVGILYALHKNKKENFQNKYTLETPGILPESNNPGILDNVFPETGFTSLQNIGASQIWKDYPIYQVGSYSQTTNNIRYPDNPDEGTCMPADFCNLYYKNREKVSNIVMPLEPVKENEGAARVNYYNSSVCGKFA